MKVKIIISFLLIFGLILPGFSFAEDQTIKAPEPSELKGIGQRFLEFFPNAFQKAWQAALGIWQKIGDWFKNVWAKYIRPKIDWFWQKVVSFLRGEIAERKPIIEEELEKEKEEVKEEIKKETEKTGKSLWERFKELIR